MNWEFNFEQGISAIICLSRICMTNSWQTYYCWYPLWLYIMSPWHSCVNEAGISDPGMKQISTTMYIISVSHSSISCVIVIASFASVYAMSWWLFPLLQRQLWHGDWCVFHSNVSYGMVIDVFHYHNDIADIGVKHTSITMT
jgi:hypothetical protein